MQLLCILRTNCVCIFGPPLDNQQLMPESAVLVVVIEIAGGSRLWLVNPGYARQDGEKDRFFRGIDAAEKQIRGLVRFSLAVLYDAS